jgi:hypothetical protein
MPRSQLASAQIDPSSDVTHRSSVRMPEISLLTAVLEEALHCVRETGRDLSHGPARDAYDWFDSERRDSPFSFLSLCDFLSIDAGALRQRLDLAQRTGFVAPPPMQQAAV